MASTQHTPGHPGNFIYKAYPDEKYRKAVFDEFDAEVSQPLSFTGEPVVPLCKKHFLRNAEVLLGPRNMPSEANGDVGVPQW